MSAPKFIRVGGKVYQKVEATVGKLETGPFNHYHTMVTNIIKQLRPLVEGPNPPAYELWNNMPGGFFHNDPAAHDTVSTQAHEAMRLLSDARKAYTDLQNMLENADAGLPLVNQIQYDRA